MHNNVVILIYFTVVVAVYDGNIPSFSYFPANNLPLMLALVVISHIGREFGFETTYSIILPEKFTYIDVIS